MPHGLGTPAGREADRVRARRSAVVVLGIKGFPDSDGRLANDPRRKFNNEFQAPRLRLRLAMRLCDAGSRT
jgi:hypothetical protein